MCTRSQYDGRMRHCPQTRLTTHALGPRHCGALMARRLERGVRYLECSLADHGELDPAVPEAPRFGAVVGHRIRRPEAARPERRLGHAASYQVAPNSVRALLR